MLNNTDFLAFKLSDVVFIVLLNVKMPTIVGILTFMSRKNFVPSCVEHGKSFITSRPYHLHDFLTFTCGSLALLNLKPFL